MKSRQVLLGNFVEKDEIDIQTGPFGTQLRASDYTSDGTPVINVRNIGYGSLRPEKLEYVPGPVVERLGKHILAVNDIVFGRKGAVDRHLLVDDSQVGWMQGSDCIRIRVQSKALLSEYLSRALCLESHKRWMITQCSNKATMASLNQDVICRIPIFLPDPSVQREIVRILSAYDDLIENNRRRIQLLEQAARLLYKEWFVHLRFPGHEHTPIVDGVPEGWGKKPLGELLTLQRGFDLPVSKRKEGHFPIYASTGINGYHAEAKVKGPGVVTGRSGSLGTVMYVSGDFWPLNTTLWVKDFKLVGPHYANHLLANMQLEQYNGGAAVPTLNRNDVHRVEVLSPPSMLLRMFEEQSHDIVKQIEALTSMNLKLTAARDLLLPKLMNGEVAV